MNAIVKKEDTEVTEYIEKSQAEKEFDEDFQRVRTDMIDVLEKTKDGLEYYIEVAKQDNTPRAFEVFGGLVNTLVAANEKMVDLHKKRREISIKENKVLNQTNIGSAVLVGSTKDLQNIIDNQRKLNMKVVNDD